jgi:hypothetical protein
MITKRHLTNYLKDLSSASPSNNGEMAPDAWRRYVEYLTDHYKRLDKNARKYADDIFDQVEAGMEKVAGALPQGPRKERLRRQIAVARGERSPVPVLYLDTPVLENVIRYALGEKLPKPEIEETKGVYETVQALVREGKLVYPENSFHRETLQIGGPLALKALEIIKTLSRGMSFKHGQSIEDFQAFRAIRGFINSSSPVDYSAYWKDSFREQTVQALLRMRPFVTFEGLPALPGTPGSPGGSEDPPLPTAARLRIRPCETALKSDQELQKRSTRHLRDLVRLGTRYLSVSERGPEKILDGFWAGQKTDMAIGLWNYLGGKPEGIEGLTSFYRSEHFRNVPAIRIKKDVWNVHGEYDEDDRRQMPPPAGMSVLASVLPYSDIVILGRRMTEVVRGRLKLDAEFDATVLASDEQEQIAKTFDEVAELG